MNELIKDVIYSTGLPQPTITKELEKLIREAGKNPINISLEELREVVANYLQDVFLELKANDFSGLLE